MGYVQYALTHTRIHISRFRCVVQGSRRQYSLTDYGFLIIFMLWKAFSFHSFYFDFLANFFFARLSFVFVVLLKVKKSQPCLETPKYVCAYVCVRVHFTSSNKVLIGFSLGVSHNFQPWANEHLSSVSHTYLMCIWYGILLVNLLWKTRITLHILHILCTHHFITASFMLDNYVDFRMKFSGHCYCFILW